MDILHAEVEESQEHDDCLLLVPCDVVSKRELVHIVEAEDFLQLECNDCQRVGVVALTCVEHARNAVDIAEVQLVVLILRAACGQNHSALRQCLCELCVVIAALCSAVAARHDDELRDGTALDRIDNLIRKCEDLCMCETADNLTGLNLGRRRALLCLLDDRAEILDLAVGRIDVLEAREADATRDPDSVLIAVLRRNQAVRGHENRAVEGLELFLLLPPSVAVVARKVRVLLEERIVVRREHLGVRVDIDAGALGLVKQHLEILQVVTRNQDARILADADVDLGDLRIAVSAGVCAVEERHAFDTVLTGLQGQCDEIVDRKAVVEGLRERLLQEAIHLFVLTEQCVCVLRVSRETLESVGDELAKGSHILVLGCENADFRRSLRISALRNLLGRSERQLRSIGKFLPECVATCERIRDALLNRLPIKVCVRNRDEEVHRHEVIHLCRNRLALRSECGRNRRETLGHINQKILRSRDIKLLAADTLYGATLVARGLLTLITKHFSVH